MTADVAALSTHRRFLRVRESVGRDKFVVTTSRFGLTPPFGLIHVNDLELTPI